MGACKKEKPTDVEEYYDSESDSDSLVGEYNNISDDGVSENYDGRILVVLI